MAQSAHHSHSNATLVGRAKALGTEMAHEIRRSNRYTKMRAAVIGGWALLSILTLWIACPSSGPSNSLGAEVQLLSDSFVGGSQLLVRNDSSDLWTDIVLTLDDTWKYEKKTLRPHDHLVLSVSQFRRGAEAPPSDYRPRLLEIECGQGRFSTPIELR